MQYEVITTYPVLRRKKKSPLNDFGWQQLHPARGRPDGSLLFDKVVLPRSVSILDSTGDLFDRECRARTVYGSGAGNITRPVLKIELPVYKTPPGHFRTPEGRFSTVLTPGKLRVFQSIKAIRNVEPSHTIHIVSWVVVWSATPGPLGQRKPNSHPISFHYTLPYRRPVTSRFRVECFEYVTVGFSGSAIHSLRSAVLWNLWVG